MRYIIITFALLLSLCGCNEPKGSKELPTPGFHENITTIIRPALGEPSKKERDFFAKYLSYVKNKDYKQFLTLFHPDLLPITPTNYQSLKETIDRWAAKGDMSYKKIYLLNKNEIKEVWEMHDTQTKCPAEPVILWNVLLGDGKEGISVRTIQDLTGNIYMF